MDIFSSNFNLKLNLINSLTRVIYHDNGVQTTNRQTISKYTECRISYWVDYVCCGKIPRREEREQDLKWWKKEDKANTNSTV